MRTQCAGKPRLSDDMYSDDDSEQRKEAEEYKAVHHNRFAAGLEVPEL